MPDSIDRILKSNQNVMKNNAPIFNPSRGMSSTLASNIINVLGANSDFIELANNNSHITGIYEYLVGQEISDRDYVDFFHENQFGNVITVPF